MLCEREVEKEEDTCQVQSWGGAVEESQVCSGQESARSPTVSAARTGSQYKHSPSRLLLLGMARQAVAQDSSLEDPLSWRWPISGDETGVAKTCHPSVISRGAGSEGEGLYRQFVCAVYG